MRRRLHGVGVWTACAGAGAIVATLVACSKSDAPQPGCTGESAAALSFAGGEDDGYCGTSPSVNCVTTPTTPMAMKQLAFTFDDGPSSVTLSLSAYLKSQGIRATFFVNGHCFGPNVGLYPQCQQNPAATPADIFTQVLADGHIVENHTQDHNDLACPQEGSCYSGPGYPATPAGDTALIKEISDTDAIVAPFISYDRFLFRAPYGRWSARDYTTLHASAMDKYHGPVKWDIGGAITSNYAADWDCWEGSTLGYSLTTKQCGDRYMNEITARGRGIVLMHDADYGDVTNHNLTSGKGNTFDMVKYLVPLLKAAGYSWIRVDEVPDIAAALPPIPDAGPDAAADAGDASVDGGGSDAASDAGAGSSSGSVPDTKPTTAPDASANPCGP